MPVPLPKYINTNIYELNNLMMIKGANSRTQYRENRIQGGSDPFVYL